ncbi:CDP-alcohol phosphatidyltransferase family protein [Teichococcus vastitatis]|jgi:cardiolipin synthase|uniref:CDP-diacylglycerol--glycerol-3-phosphate 3-phosphatidyltransferase n=1 Tax=Teichococcus vastitatis TaxID=2307076 RepID=A0ABS9W4M6_9PROT|nr:CDP-alcohol phosphatidyltransferase family protein [Pseudoroseomonas vastitatis]MCI0754136.1 CDP-alcohol phosphatidyltransferase family protein [Pseudoroseomonas vastitatis]
MLRLLPNAITLARLCAVPATVWLILHDRLDAAFLMFAAAGVSDALDGWLARRLDAHSPLGAMLDPVADKALLVCTYLCLTWRGVLPDWLTILVVFRDALIVGGVALLALLGQPPRMAPLRLSKWNTAAQIVLAGLALATAGFALPAETLVELMIVVVAVTTVLSGAGYFLRGLRGGVPL